MRQIARRVRRAQPRSPSGDGMRRTVTVLVAMTMVALLVGACEGSSGSGPGTGDKAGSSSTLTIGHTIPPNSMDPAKINTSSDWYTTLAYDPLIYMAPDGTLEPRLAESWRYVGKDYKTFELKLRSKVTFSDGASLTAAGVKAHIEYFQKAGGIGASLVKDIAAVDAVDALTVRIRLSAPHPQMPVLFTQGFLVGNVISPKALDSPATLATQTFGAGQYTLVPSETVANDRYTYTPNPDYWNPDDIHSVSCRATRPARSPPRRGSRLSTSGGSAGVWPR